MDIPGTINRTHFQLLYGRSVTVGRKKHEYLHHALFFLTLWLDLPQNDIKDWPVDFHLGVFLTPPPKFSSPPKIYLLHTNIETL